MNKSNRDFNLAHPHKHGHSHGGLEPIPKNIPRWLRHAYTDCCQHHWHGELPSAFYDTLTYSEELAHLIHDIQELQQALYGGDLIEMYNILMSILHFFDPVFGRINEYQALIPEGEKYSDVLKKVDYVMRTFVTTKFDKINEYKDLQNEGFNVTIENVNDTYPEVYSKTAQILPEVLQALDFTHRYWKTAFFTPIEYNGNYNVILKLTSGDDFPTHLANIEYGLKHVNWLTGKVKEHEDSINDIYNEITNIYNDITNINTTINGLLGLDFKRLVEGTDYEITYYNGWSTTDTVEVLVNKSISVTQVKLQSRASETSRLLNSNLNQTAMSHGSSSGEDYNKSRIYKVKFLNEYAFLNNGTERIPWGGQGVVNITPTSARASWSWNIDLEFDDGVVATWTSYYDGYNTDLTSNYGTGLSTGGANLNISFSMSTPE